MEEEQIETQEMCPDCNVPMMITSWQDPATRQREVEAECPECGGTETTQ